MALRHILALVLLAAGVVGAQTDEKRDQIVSKLHTMKVSLDFRDTPLPDVVDFLREMAGFNILIDPKVLEELPSERQRVTLKVDDLELASALRLLLGLRDLTAVYREGALVVVTKHSLQEEVFVRIYDVRDLIQPVQDFQGPTLALQDSSQTAKEGRGPEVFFIEPTAHPKVDPEKLVQMIKDATGGDTWQGDKASIQLSNGVVIVCQSKAVHQEIEEFIRRLRAAR